jgi:hypothetical protein
MYEKVYTYDKVLCYYSPITVLLSQIENCCNDRIENYGYSHLSRAGFHTAFNRFKG